MSTKTKRQTIRERLNGKVSAAIHTMCQGLRSNSEREDFRVDMTTFGTRSYISTRDGVRDYPTEDEEKICYGCAATCTIQQIAKKQFVDADIYYTNTRAKFLGFEENDLQCFEFAIDDLRKGQLAPLIAYMNGYAGDYDETKEWSPETIDTETKMMSLLDTNGIVLDHMGTMWRLYVPAYEKAAEVLEAAGY